MNNDEGRKVNLYAIKYDWRSWASSQYLQQYVKKVEDISKLNLGAGLGLGFDFNGGVFAVGIGTSITNPYTGSLDLKSKVESFSAGLLIRF